MLQVLYLSLPGLIESDYPVIAEDVMGIEDRKGPRRRQCDRGFYCSV